MTQATTQNIDVDCECPECGRPAEKGGVSDFRDNGGEKFRTYIHKRNDSALETIDDWCAETLEE